MSELVEQRMIGIGKTRNLGHVLGQVEMLLDGHATKVGESTLHDKKTREYLSIGAKNIERWSINQYWWSI